MFFFLLEACDNVNFQAASQASRAESWADTDVEAVDTAETADDATGSDDSADDEAADVEADSAEAAEVEAPCTLLAAAPWVDNAGIKQGLTVHYHLEGCGVPVHASCDDDTVVEWAFDGDLQDGTFEWAVTAVDLSARRRAP